MTTLHGDAAIEVIRGLLNKTEENKLTWEPGVGNDDLVAETPKHVYKIWSRDGDGLHPYFLTISTSSGGPQVADIVSTLGDFEDALNNHLWRLYSLARDAAAVPVVEDILNDLEEL